MTGLGLSDRGPSVLRQFRLSLARLIGWFAADSQRIRAAAVGVLACVVAGVFVGVAVGSAVDVVVTLLSEVLRPGS